MTVSTAGITAARARELHPDVFPADPCGTYTEYREAAPDPDARHDLVLDPVVYKVWMGHCYGGMDHGQADKEPYSFWRVVSTDTGPLYLHRRRRVGGTTWRTLLTEAGLAHIVAHQRGCGRYWWSDPAPGM